MAGRTAASPNSCPGPGKPPGTLSTASLRERLCCGGRTQATCKRKAGAPRAPLTHEQPVTKNYDIVAAIGCNPCSLHARLYDSPRPSKGRLTLMPQKPRQLD